MTVWSLTTDTDTGIITRLYLTEGQAYDALSRIWFPHYDRPPHDDVLCFGAMQEALAKGIPEVGESAVSRWFYEHLETTGDDGRVVIERHDHPWVFEAENTGPTGKFVAERIGTLLRGLGSNFTTPVIAAQFSTDFSNYGLQDTFDAAYKATAAPDDNESALEGKYRQFALDYLPEDNEIEIDADAEVSIGEDGGWVAAWVFVSKENIAKGDDDHRTGGEPERGRTNYFDSNGIVRKNL